MVTESGFSHFEFLNPFRIRTRDPRDVERVLYHYVTQSKVDIRNDNKVYPYYKFKLMLMHD